MLIFHQLIIKRDKFEFGNTLGCVLGIIHQNSERRFQRKYFINFPDRCRYLLTLFHINKITRHLGRSSWCYGIHKIILRMMVNT